MDTITNDRWTATPLLPPTSRDEALARLSDDFDPVAVPLPRVKVEMINGKPVVVGLMDPWPPTRS